MAYLFIVERSDRTPLMSLYEVKDYDEKKKKKQVCQLSIAAATTEKECLEILQEVGERYGKGKIRSEEVDRTDVNWALEIALSSEGQSLRDML
eukprot:7200765-Alexandrium_andersonii.AAC.1